MTIARITPTITGTGSTGAGITLAPQAVSADGNMAVFLTGSQTLSSANANGGLEDVFLYRDGGGGSLTSITGHFKGVSATPSISDDGTRVLFYYSNTGGTGMLGATGVYVYDTSADPALASSFTRTPIAGGLQTNGLVMSGNGKVAVFASGDTIHVANLATFVTTSVRPTSGLVRDVSISDDGTQIAFSAAQSQSNATNVVGSFSVRDTGIGGPGIISNTAHSTYEAEISGDGRFVAYSTAAPQSPADTGGTFDVVVYDIRTGTTSTDTIPANGNDRIASLSDDGRFVVYQSDGRLLPGDTDALIDVYVLDRATGETRLAAEGLQGNVMRPAISGDGSTIYLVSNGANAAFGQVETTPDIIVQNVYRADNPFMVPSAQADNLTGTTGDDTIDLLAGDDVYDGGAGNDTITGGFGADTVAGGAGDDTFVIRAGHVADGDSIDGGDGTDTILISGGGTVSLAGLGMTGVEAIVIDSAADGTTLDLSGAPDAETRLALAGLIASADGGDDAVDIGQAQVEIDLLRDLRTAGVELVGWVNANGDGLVADTDAAQPGIVVTRVAATDGLVTTITFDADGTLREVIASHAGGREVTKTYDADGALTSTLVEDSGDVAAFASIRSYFEGTGLTQRVVLLDNGIETTTDYVNGARDTVTARDTADAFDFATKTTTYVHGVRTAESIVYDDHGTLASRWTMFDPAGGIATRTSVFLDGDTRVLGGAGDNLLLASAGSDLMTGRAGADTFAFLQTAGTDRITDFTDGVDHLDLTGLGVLDMAGLEAIASLSELRGSTVITYDDGSGTLTLTGLSLADFGDDDFAGLTFM